VPPTFDGFTLRNVTVDGAAQVLNLVGVPSDPIVRCASTTAPSPM
jgi:hypothetical protein